MPDDTAKYNLVSRCTHFCTELRSKDKGEKEGKFHLIWNDV